MQQNLRMHAGTAAADRAGTWMKLGWLAIAVGGIYILSAKLSLSLLTPDGVAVFWPAAGVAAGALIASGPWARWAVVAGTMVATIVANLMGDRNLVSSMIFAVCNAGEALLTAGLIERYFGWPFSLDRLRQVLGLLGAAAVAAAVSGIGGTLGFVLLRGETTSAFNTWQNWFASDALGIVTIAPLVIGLASAARDPPRPNETIEGLTALALLVVMSVIILHCRWNLGRRFCRSRCCFRSCCGSRLAAGRCSRRRRRSSSRWRSSGPQRSASATSAMPVSR